MRLRWIPVVAFSILAVSFIIDLVTPQTLVVAILFDVPIALVALAGSRRLTATMVVLALLANVVAGYFNGLQEGSTWGLIGVGDRLLTALSIVIVGYLSIAIQEQGQRAGRAAAQELRVRREAELAAAVDRIRSSLSNQLVVRAIVKEALQFFGASSAEWLPASADGEYLSAGGGSGVETRIEPPGPGATSVLRRVLDDDGVESFDTNDAFGRTVAALLSAHDVVAIPFRDAGREFGVLLLGYAAGRSAETLGLARMYARAGSAALTQADLFEELARRNERLGERGAVIRDLVYSLSHDARTPLAALQMTLVQAKEGAFGELPPRYRTVLEASISSTQDLLDLAETLLRVARLETGEAPSVHQPIDVRALVAEIASEFDALTQERDIALTWSAGDAAVTQGDPGDVRRALRNLVSNAVAHTPGGGHVAIDVSSDGAMVHVRVSDDGSGVPSTVRAALFERFAHASTGNGLRDGVGLGLYLARRVAEELGGRVAYQPRDPQGSIFIMQLPRVPIVA